MSSPKSTRFLVSMTAVVLLVVSAAVNGASVAVDSKSADVAKAENVQPDTDAAQERTKKLETEASVAEEHESSDPRIGLYAQKPVNFDSIGPIGANKAFYLASTDGGYGQPVSGYQTNYGASMPAYSNYAMAPPPSNQYYTGYQMPSAYPQAPPTSQTPVYSGSQYGAVFNNPPPSYSPAYVPSYTVQPPPTTVAPPYPPPSTANPPPAQAYTEGYPAQTPAQQPPYNVFTPFAYTSGYGVNTGFAMVPGYGSATAPVSPSSYGSFGSYGAQVTQVPYGSPMAAYAPMQQQTSTYGLPMGAVPFGVNMNRVPDAYVSSGMGGFASYGPVNAGPVMPPMNSFSASFAPLSSEMNPGMASVPNVGAYHAPAAGGY